MAAALGRGDLKLHGWVYKFETGEVFAFHPDKNAFLPIDAISPPATVADRALPRA